MNRVVFFVDSDVKHSAAKQFILSHYDVNTVWRQISTGPADKQDMFMAAVSLQLHPEWKECYPALKHTDISYDSVQNDRVNSIMSEFPNLFDYDDQSQEHGSYDF